MPSNLICITCFTKSINITFRQQPKILNKPLDNIFLVYIKNREINEIIF